MTSADANILLTPAEAAERLRMKESRIRRLAQKGLIASRKDGQALRFAPADLADYAESIARPRANPYRTVSRKASR